MEVYMQHKKLSPLDLAQQMGESCIGVRVGRLHRLVARHYENALRPLGLSLPQLEVLTGLTLLNRPVKPADIAEWLGIERSTMSRNLAIMQDNGWVVVTETSPTGRSMAVTLSPRGKAKLVEAQQAWNQAQRAVLEVLDPSVVATLDDWLEGLTTGASA
jgi:DNA-binding MarR family transcriptional regulator